MITNKLFFLFLFIYSAVSNAMELPLVDKAKEIGRQIARAKEALYEQTANEFLEGKSGYSFDNVARICKPHYAPLLEELLRQKKIDANLGEVYNTKNDRPQRVNILTEAIESAINDCDAPHCAANAAVEVLLKYGADTQFATFTSDETCSDLCYELYYWQTPLLRATYSNNPDLVQLLLDHKADPNQVTLSTRWGKPSEIIPLIECLDQYSFAKRHEKDTQKIVQIMELLLQKGADSYKRIKVPCLKTESLSFFAYLFRRSQADNNETTPMQFAQENNFPEIVALFKRYQK